MTRKAIGSGASRKGDMKTEQVAEKCKCEAQIWAQEARTHQSIVRECYAAAGVTGKADSNGAWPVQEAFRKLKAERDRLRELLLTGIALFDMDEEANEVGTDSWVWLQRARAALDAGKEQP